MTKTLAIAFIRVAASAAGLLGFLYLIISAIQLPQTLEEPSFLPVMVIAFILTFSCYMLYVAFLVWFRFSPLAVRHVCGEIGFGVLVIANSRWPVESGQDNESSKVYFMVCLVAVFIAYRFAFPRLGRLIFPEGEPG